MKYLFVTLILSFSFSLFSQDKLIGINLGVGITKKIQRPSSVNSKIGNHYGITYEVRPDGKFSYLIELHSLTRKFNNSYEYISNQGNNETFDVNVRLNYVELPLKIGYSLNKKNTTRFNLGFVISRLIDHKESNNSSNNLFYQYGSVKGENRLRWLSEIDVNLVNNRNYELFTTLSSTFGYRPMYDFNPRIPHSKKHVSFDLSVGYRFKI